MKIIFQYPHITYMVSFTDEIINISVFGAYKISISINVLICNKASIVCGLVSI